MKEPVPYQRDQETFFHFELSFLFSPVRDANSAGGTDGSGIRLSRDCTVMVSKLVGSTWIPVLSTMPFQKEREIRKRNFISTGLQVK
jgi:calcineurin-like phosphoesterase